MDCDIAIAGGGPAGLASAAAIIRAVPQLRVKVFESASEYRPQGAGVLINLNGQNALEAIDPKIYERMKARSVNVLGSESMDKDGNKKIFKEMGSWHGIDFQERYGKSLFFLGWHEIRETLYQALPPGVVEFGRRYVSYDDQGDDGVVVNFKDGSTVRARVLIGADGYFSKVRQQMLGDGPPPFTGNIMWRARFPLRQGFSTDRTRWWRENMDSFAGRFAVIFPIDAEHVTFVANAPVEHLHQHGLPFKADTSRSVQEDVFEKDNLQRCLTVFQDFDERLLKVLRDTDPSTVTEHGLYQRLVDEMPDEGWCRGNVTIIGDAAHAGLPNGQGVNLAFEDGAVLAWHLREGGLTAESLQRFNAERGPRVREVLTKGLDNHRGPEKERVIYETKFRPVQGDGPGSGPDAPFTPPVSPKHRKATVTASIVHPTTASGGDSRQLTGLLSRGGYRSGAPGKWLQIYRVQKPLRWRSYGGDSSVHGLRGLLSSGFLAHC